MSTTLRFACTQCGLCCDRSPEVELSEAAQLADTFVFRLMFRLYRLARSFDGADDADGAEAFYQKKRLLGAYAARRQVVKARQNGRTVEHHSYLTITALALDTSPGRCGALLDGRCGVYDRRPSSCRTVPLHYSRIDALAAPTLTAFAAKPGYRCDTSAAAPLMVADGRIVDADIVRERADALALATGDRPWHDAILRRMKSSPALPTLREVEANAPFGATTASMRTAWRIAAEEGLMPTEQCTALVEAQRALIEREFGRPGCMPETRATLDEMRLDYRGGLGL